MRQSNRLTQRLDRLTEHLQTENPDLVHAVNLLRELDTIAHNMGLLPESESYANRLSWWPLISLLGTFSSGKSSFINTLIGMPLQKTGNQAVDDRFTVITYSQGSNVQTLPGQALDSDPRFPFYRISEDLHDAVPGEGEKIDQYLQMKVVPSEAVRGKIIIDSPGFDADEQRTSVLEITEHIIGLSDLVLVFFDARHPEAGAMRDTLAHLVPAATNTKDKDKFLFILNQIDTSAREDNMEEVVAAWRSALSQAGLNTGNFYVHYNEDLAIPVPDDKVWQRYQHKRNADFERIAKRIHDINVHRTYRIIGKIKPLADDIEYKAVPKLIETMDKWRSSVVMYDFMALALIALLFGLFITTAWGYIDKYPVLFIGAIGVSVFSLIYSHYSAKAYFADKLEKTLGEEAYGDLAAAFKKSTAGWRSVFWRFPSGYGLHTRKTLERIREKTESLIVSLNTKMANPSGRHQTPPPAHLQTERVSGDRQASGYGNQPFSASETDLSRRVAAHPAPATAAGGAADPASLASLQISDSQPEIRRTEARLPSALDLSPETIHSSSPPAMPSAIRPEDMQAAQLRREEADRAARQQIEEWGRINEAHTDKDSSPVAVSLEEQEASTRSAPQTPAELPLTKPVSRKEQAKTETASSSEASTGKVTNGRGTSEDK